jgi:serine/threonine protein kinase/tetratricopeptide (TPR) repeat protein
MTADADRHLLFGLLALQNGMINQGQLVAAFQGWTLDKSTGLAEHLEARGDLDADDRAAVEALVARHLKRHGGDAEKSLAAVPAGRSTRESLVRIGDPDIDATLGHVPSAHVSTVDDDADRTASYAVGTATSDGQRFRVVRPHARGGLGAVFVALDAELNREVALKQILDHHADDPTSRQRFLIEAEITGGLEHPGIVPVYGLGTYGSGRPYYAMRFIKGDSLKEAIERFHADAGSKADPGPRSLELRKLLRSFMDICNAINYAHSRGVLHRDIKPANIIVGKHGETLVVDWGLAKPLGRVEPGSDTGERTIMPRSASGSADTLPGSALGTPAYMSPEQARGELDRLGPPSDIYSLGATLYCLLTGRPPYEGEDIGEVLRKVQRGDVVPPRSLDAAIDPALEAVCLKSMAVEPEHRYATSRAMADDVERWMADEPVKAWHEPLSRRARRWARQNRTAVTSLAAAVLVALGGTAAVLAVQTRANSVLTAKNAELDKANRLKDEANADLLDANQRVIGANADLESANVREKQRFDLAMEAIKLFHGEVGDDLVLKADQFKPLRDKLLKGAADFYGRLEGLLKGQTDRASRGAMGNAYFELGDLTAKIGNQSEALAVHRKALAVRRSLADGSEATAAARLDVARSLIADGILAAQIGDVSGALAAFEEARSLTEGLIASDGPSDEVREILGLTGNHIAMVMRDNAGKPLDALKTLDRVLAIRRALVEANPSVERFQSDLANSYNQFGVALNMIGKPSEALDAFGRSLAIRQKLADANPSVVQFQSDLGKAYNNIGAMLQMTDKPSEAIEALDKAVAIRQKLADANPAVTQFQHDLAFSLDNRSDSYRRLRKLPEALAETGRALAVYQKLVDANPAVTNYQIGLARSHSRMALVLYDLGSRPRRCRRYAMHRRSTRNWRMPTPLSRSSRRPWRVTSAISPPSSTGKAGSRRQRPRARSRFPSPRSLRPTIPRSQNTKKWPRSRRPIWECSKPTRPPACGSVATRWPA